MQPVVRITNLLTSAKVVSRSIESAATDCDSHRAKAKHRKVTQEGFSSKILALTALPNAKWPSIQDAANHEHSNVLSMTLSA